MPTPMKTGAAPARAMTPLSLLVKLAKRDSQAELVIKPDGARELRIGSRGLAAGCSSAVVSYAVFAAARDQGWLADIDGLGLRWSLSQEGRLALRRTRSAGGGAIKPGHCSPQEAPASTPSHASIDAAESPLGWLRRRRDKSGQPMLSAMQFDAGERLRGDMWFAQMSPRVTANWSGTGGSSRSGGGLGIDIRDNVSAAQQRVRRALAAVGPISAGLLLDVCGHLLGLEQIERARGWPPRSGKVALQMALCELARHYGLPGTEATSRPAASRLHHWGTGDYRPGTDTSAD